MIQTYSLHQKCLENKKAVRLGWAVCTYRTLVRGSTTLGLLGLRRRCYTIGLQKGWLVRANGLAIPISRCCNLGNRRELSLYRRTAGIQGTSFRVSSVVLSRYLSDHCTVDTEQKCILYHRTFCTYILLERTPAFQLANRYHS